MGHHQRGGVGGALGVKLASAWSPRARLVRACTHKIAIGNSDLIMSALAHFADSRRTSPEVRNVPIVLQVVLHWW